MAEIEIAKKSDLDMKADKDHNHDEVYALKSHKHSYNDLTDLPEIPSIEGLAHQDDINMLQDLINSLSATVAELESRLDALSEPQDPGDTES